MDLSNILKLPTGDLDPGNSQEAQEELERKRQEEYDLSMQFKRVFGSTEGKAVLDHLKSRTIDGPTWNFNLRAEDATINGYAREGQNSIYRYIVEKIHNADRIKEQDKT